MSFVDDTSLAISDANDATLYQRANVEMNNLFEWFCANDLSLNKVSKPPKLIVFLGGGTRLKQTGSQFQEKTINFYVFVDVSFFEILFDS